MVNLGWLLVTNALRTRVDGKRLQLDMFAIHLFFDLRQRELNNGFRQQLVV